MIEIDNVTKSYTRGETVVHALRGLSCSIAKGSLTLVVGPSGSGKSSLLYLVGALDHPTSGDIRVAGRSLVGMPRKERDLFRRDQVGYIFQNFNLLQNLTALDNVLVPYLPSGISPKQRTEGAELLERLGLGRRMDHKPSQLSGGEQQRVAIARALLKRPLLVLGDEPTGELDSQTGSEIYTALRDLQREQGSTVIIVTHDKSHVRPGDCLLTIRDGRLADQTVYQSAPVSPAASSGPILPGVSA
jgi:putative ABC transport system ATP-binding protein